MKKKKNFSRYVRNTNYHGHIRILKKHILGNVYIVLTSDEEIKNTKVTFLN